jgi:hypothetical protein
VPPQPVNNRPSFVATISAYPLGLVRRCVQWKLINLYESFCEDSQH